MIITLLDARQIIRHPVGEGVGVPAKVLNVHGSVLSIIRAGRRPRVNGGAGALNAPCVGAIAAGAAWASPLLLSG